MKTLSDLQKTRPAKSQPLDLRDVVADEWRAGTIVRWVPTFNRFLWTGERVTIRPGDSLAQLGTAHGGLIGVIIL